MPSLFHLLERSVACTAEENVLPALVLRARSAAHVGVVGPPTEPVAWIPKSLANGSVVSSATVRWLLGSLHTPQSLCHRASGGGGAATTVAAGGCTACPDPGKWPQTKFIVKRVADDPRDASGVRRLLEGLTMTRDREPQRQRR